MTHRRFLLTACAALLGAALVQSAPLFAQQSATPPAPPADRRTAVAGTARRGPATIDEHVARMTTELGLNSDQAGKVRTLITTQQRTQDSVLARRVAAQDAERAAMHAMQTNGEKALAGILTADQKLKHDAMRARRGGTAGYGRMDRAHRGGRRGGAADHRDGRHESRRDNRGDRRGPPDADAHARHGR